MRRFEGYLNGVNLGGWLSQCDHTKKRYDTFIVEKDIETIKNWGLDHVRVPVDYNLIEDEKGNYREEGFGYIQKAIDWCGKYGLNMVLDVHKTYGFSFDKGENEIGFFDNEDYQERFCRMWEQLAARYGKYSDRVAFELLNEVTSKSFSDKWNRISDVCIKRIRKIAPVTKILLGGYYNNSIEALQDLPDPTDENVVLNFHFYEPLIFTHQGAGWIETMDRNFRMPFRSAYEEYNRFGRENLPGFMGLRMPEGVKNSDVIDEKYFLNMMEWAANSGRLKNAALYCGEFGVIENATPEDTLDWYRLVIGSLNKYGIGHALWSYKGMNFGMADERMDAVRDKILALV